MRVLALASQKGGSGKTTLSGHLAVQAQRAGAGPVVVIDIDPQGSLTEWWNERSAEFPALAQTSVARLAADLVLLREKGFKLAVIDTPPAITMAIQNNSLSIAEIAGKFDILCLFQVLEHMDRLNELFERLNALSKTDSHLFISVPNAELIEFNESHGSLLDMPPNHIGRWNYQAFECIASQFGWLIKDYQKEPFNLKAILKQQIAYHYLRLSQCSSSLANRIERLKSENIRKPLRIFCACCYALCNISTLVQTLRNKNLGDSQWIHLVKSTK